MSIYIQGMKMPKKPGEPITVTIFRTGSVWSPHVDLSEARAIELPPHGRLIDADKVETERHGNNSQRIMWSNIRQLLSDAETIIPADPGGKPT